MALQKVLAFDWPNTRVVPSTVALQELNAIKLGYLKSEGYAVGRGGRGLRERQQILERCYRRVVLPNIFSDDYIEQWGPAGSSQRLHKIADSIATFCCNHKRKSNRSQEAIDDWERDLEWLKETFYNGKYWFDWPGTDVW